MGTKIILWLQLEVSHFRVLDEAPQLQRLQNFFSGKVQEVGQSPHLEGAQLIKGAAYLNAVFIGKFFMSERKQFSLPGNLILTVR